MRLVEWLTFAVTRLTAAGVESPRLEAQVLAAHVLGADRTWVLTHGDSPFPAPDAEPLLRRREAREPLAYILGWREFYGRRFRVTPDVLIPRQDTETLVEAALSPLPSAMRKGRGLGVLDLGTGSGCLAVTLKLERPEWAVTAVDISPTALAVAQQNADELEAEIRFVLSDGFLDLLGESFDLIVTNPPYIGRSEELPPEVGRHEPALALYGGDTGLEFYARLAREAKDHLNDGGRLLMELGRGQASPVRALFEEAGWRYEGTWSDLAGIERVLGVRSVFACAI